jgi:CheY-like chemotaxis protein
MSDDARPAVLVVEDEPLIRMDAVDVVEDAGFRAYEAASADEAMSILETHEDVFVLFTDVDMPGSMNGLKLAASVRNRWPSVRIIIASGAVEVKREDMPDHALFFSKPYRSDRIADALRALSEGGSRK